MSSHGMDCLVSRQEEEYAQRKAQPLRRLRCTKTVLVDATTGAFVYETESSS